MYVACPLLQRDCEPTLRRTVSPSLEPVTLAELKLQARIDGDDEDSGHEAKLVAAREKVESDTQRAFVTQTWQLTLDRFPSQIELDVCPVLAVSGITYINTDGDLTTLATSLYTANVSGEPGRIRPAYGTVFPSVRSNYPGAVTVTFTAGYGSGASTTPQSAKHAILLLAAHWNENREAASDRSVKGVELAYDSLVRSLRWRA